MTVTGTYRPAKVGAGLKVYTSWFGGKKLETGNSLLEALDAPEEKKTLGGVAMPTAEDVAAWMLEELQREKVLYQEAVVSEIETRFGEEFTYANANGNLAIAKRVLEEFRVLSGERVGYLGTRRALLALSPILR